MIIVYSNKSLISKKLVPHFASKYPQKEIIFIHSLLFVNILFEYPQNIKFKEFPYIEKSKFKLNKIENWKPLKIIDDELISVNLTFEDVKNCEEIIYAAEITETDTYFFSEFVNKIYGKSIEEINIKAIQLFSLEENKLKTTMNNMNDFNTLFEETVNKGRVSKYFDYNFNFNSFALFGKVYKKIDRLLDSESIKSNISENVLISKYMLQLLYFISNEQKKRLNHTWDSIFYQMSKWKGTGKYSFRIELGSMTSKNAIVENLLNLKLIEYKGKEIYLTIKGQEFLNYLPKDCMDSDLPFRIQLWSEKPFEMSKVHIDKYLEIYFKKVKNKLKN